MKSRRLVSLLSIVVLAVLVTPPVSAATSVYTTTADFDAGTKSSSSGNFEVETNTDNPGISADQLELGSVKGDRFTFADADATTWKWTRQGSSNAVCGQSVTAGVMRAAFDPALGAKDCAIASNVLISGNYEVRVLGRISIDGDSPIGQVGRHLCVLDVQVDCSRVASAYPAGVDGFEYDMFRTSSNVVGVSLFNITNGVSFLLGTTTFIEPLCRTGATFCGLRFVKTGASTYEAYYSTNGGETWTLDESVTVSGKPESLYPHAAASDNPDSPGATTVELDDYYLVAGTPASGGFRATGTWDTPTTALSDHTVTSITLGHSGLGAGASPEIGSTFFVDEINGVCGGQKWRCPQTLDWTGAGWGTPVVELAQVSATQDRMKAVWDVATGSTLHWFATSTHDLPKRLFVFRCTNVDVCSIEDIDPGSANNYEIVDGAIEIFREWDLEIEQSSGELLLVWDNDAASATADFCYRTRTAGVGGTWSDPETCVDHTAMGAGNEELDLIYMMSNPGSNRIGAGFNDNFNQDFLMATWDGSAWVNLNGTCSTATGSIDDGGLVLTEDSADEFVAYCGNGNNSTRECEWTSAGGWESTVSCASFDSEPDVGDDDWFFGEARYLPGTNTGMVCTNNDINDINCWTWDGVSGTGGTRAALFEVTDSADVNKQAMNAGFDWNPDQSTTRDVLIVYPVNAGSLVWGTYDNSADTFTVGSGTVHATPDSNFVWGYRAIQSSDTWKVHIARGRTGGGFVRVEMFRWDGSATAPGSLQTLTTFMSNPNIFSMALQTNPTIPPLAYIDLVEVLDDGVPVWSYATDITSGTSTTLTPNQVVSGDVAVRVTLAGDGSATPVLESVEYVYEEIAGGNPRISRIFPSFTYAVDGKDVAFQDRTRYEGVNRLEHTWSFGDGTTATGTRAPVHAYEAGGVVNTYWVTLTVCDGVLCRGAAQQVVVVRWDLVFLLAVATSAVVLTFVAYRRWIRSANL